MDAIKLLRKGFSVTITYNTLLPAYSIYLWCEHVYRKAWLKLGKTMEPHFPVWKVVWYTVDRERPIIHLHLRYHMVSRQIHKVVKFLSTNTFPFCLKQGLVYWWWCWSPFANANQWTTPWNVFFSIVALQISNNNTAQIAVITDIQ